MPKVAQDVCDIEGIVTSTHALDHRLFAGELDKSKLGFPERAVVRAARAQEGDYRDWGAIEAWASDIAATLGSSPS